MGRVLLGEVSSNLDQKVTVMGWAQTVRDHGKLTFFDLRDRTGLLQCVGHELPKISIESAVKVVGTIKSRPEKLVNKNVVNGEYELQVETVEILNKAEEMPFDMGDKTLNLELPTLLDWRPLTLKHESQQSIFRVQSAVSEGFRNAAAELGCREIFVPTISPSSTEGGAEVFKIQYYDTSAYLTQSPQLYKQMMVGVFERVFLFSHAYRAEPSVTTRHLSEVVQLDCEIAFVENFSELLDALEMVGTKMISHAATVCQKELETFGIKPPLVPNKVPRLKLREAQDIVSKRTGRDLSRELDLNPEDEKEICTWALEEHNSDFVTITHFPTKKRAFYTMPDPEEPEYSLSYDLLFRGIEISSGSQRVHNYEQLLSILKERGFNKEQFDMYLMAFRFGMPPEGGFSFGLERITMKLLELGNVREAALFPRDMDRIDTRLSRLQ